MSQPRPNETKETADLFIALIKSIELLKNVYIWPQEFIVFEKKKIRDLCFTVPAGGGLIDFFTRGLRFYLLAESFGVDVSWRF